MGDAGGGGGGPSNAGPDTFHISGKFLGRKVAPLTTFPRQMIPIPVQATVTTVHPVGGFKVVERASDRANLHRQFLGYFGKLVSRETNENQFHLQMRLS